MSRRALTLAEAIVAVFVLMSGVVVLTRLFHTSIRYQTLVDDQLLAAMLAERQLEKIRGWSRQVHRCPGGSQDFADWSGCPGAAASFQDSEFPSFRLEVSHQAQVLYSPCSLFEELYPASEQRRISSSVRRVLVKVSWGARSEHRLVSLVALPTGEPGSVTVTTNGTTTVNRNDTRNATVTAVNADNRALPDLFYNHLVQPAGGNQGGGFAAIGPSRDGRVGALRHCIYDVGSTVVGYGIGQCSLRALARYRGRPLGGSSDVLDLLP